MAAKKPKKKPTVFTYYIETIPTSDHAFVLARLNVIGSLGWKLVLVTVETYWFIGDENSQTPKLPDPREGG